MEGKGEEREGDRRVLYTREWFPLKDLQTGDVITIYNATTFTISGCCCVAVRKCKVHHQKHHHHRDDHDKSPLKLFWRGSFVGLFT